MKIYTKTGDDGTTSLFGAGRVEKYSSRIEAYGNVDETNALIGICREQEGANMFNQELIRIQQLLFVLGADLATPLSVEVTYNIPRIDEHDVIWLEKLIDKHDSQLPELRSFILSGGSSLAGFFHQARTVARRAERSMVLLAQKEDITLHDVPFINRLSDLLFVYARRANQILGVADTEWDGKKPS
jgi:cob(I)alamin adenosyltransferase